MNEPRILIVEDEPLVATDLSAHLYRLGYQPVGQVASGARAIALAGELRPDLVLMDIRLEGPMDGVDAALEIRQRFQIPSIFLSGFSEKATIDRAKLAEPFAYILKPFEGRELRANIEMALYKHRVEGALRQNEERYRAVVEDQSELIARFRPDGTLLFVNGAYCRFFGQKLEEITGQKWQAVPVPEDLPQIEAQLRQLSPAQPVVVIENRVFSSSGEVRWMQFINRGFFDAAGQLTEMQAVGRDITARKQAETELRASEERYRSLVEDSPDAIGIYQEGKLAFINAAGAKLFGATTTQELLGRKSDQIIHPEDHPAAQERLRRLRAGETGVYPAEVRYLRLDGSAVAVEVSAESVNLHGQPAMQFIARDITERKRLEARARQAQKMEAIGHLAGGMAHEFNNILAAMMLGLDLTRREPQTPEANDLLREIQSLADRSAKLVSHLLAFSRKSVIHRKPLDLAAVVTQQTKVLNRLLSERIRFQFALANSQTWVEADQSSVEQVLLNLCLNARDAMPEGGGLRVGLASAEVSAETAAAHPQVQPGKFVCLSVADTGCGMDEKTMQRLFEPFFTTKDVGQGTGLGLATVRGLVEQHHGWVEAESRVGAGSTFRVYLPATAPATATAPAPRDGGMVRGEGTLLLVEDEPALLKVGKTLLSRNGYTVLTAADGDEALAVWAQHPGKVDLLLTDMVMPGKLSGLQLAERLRAEQPGLRVIITSGYNTELPDPDKDYAAADIVYLPKPCPAALLTRVIHDCLQRK